MNDARATAGDSHESRPAIAAWPAIAVTAVIAWNFWELRAALLPVQYMNDSALHAQMVRFATRRLMAGHDPLTSWFPYLGLGSPQFLHYQSTPAILTGLIGIAVGPGAAFRWSGYLLWCLWPAAIYWSARVFGLSLPASACSAVVAPLLSSVPGIGYEQHAYVFTGIGVWTQLWGAWSLPFAWALSWRAAADKRFIAPAAALVALTAALHFETGYLAFAAIPIMPFLSLDGIRTRIVRAAALLATALLASAWVVVPLLRYAHWAAINQALAAGPSANGYGARTTLGWLFTGRLLDSGHLPVISLLAAAGLVITISQWRQGGPRQALAVLLCAALLLSFGRTTFGSGVDIIPGGTDVFFRRFLMGAQLAAIYLAGVGAAAMAAPALRLAARCARLLRGWRLAWLSWVPAATLILAGLAWLSPAWLSLDSFEATNSADIQVQLRAETMEEPQTTAMIDFLRRHGGGRAYAGAPETWGVFFAVGQVPMFEYLTGADIDEIGYTLRTASLMSQPEFLFDAANPGDYALFGIRYVILPATTGPAPPRDSVLVLRNQEFRVFELPRNSYLTVAETKGTVTADRADIGSQTLPYLRSAEPGLRVYDAVGFAGGLPAPATLGRRAQLSATASAGTMLTARVDLADGRASATVRLRRRAVVVLAASFDPGWSATIDGHAAPVQMVSPALVAVAVPPGRHRVAFRYTGFADYPELFALAVASLLLTAALTSRASRERPGTGVRAGAAVSGPFPGCCVRD